MATASSRSASATSLKQRKSIEKDLKITSRKARSKYLRGIPRMYLLAGGVILIIVVSISIYAIFRSTDDCEALAYSIAAKFFTNKTRIFLLNKQFNELNVSSVSIKTTQVFYSYKYSNGTLEIYYMMLRLFYNVSYSTNKYGGAQGDIYLEYINNLMVLPLFVNQTTNTLQLAKAKPKSLGGFTIVNITGVKPNFLKAFRQHVESGTIGVEKVRKQIRKLATEERVRSLATLNVRHYKCFKQMYYEG